MKNPLLTCLLCLASTSAIVAQTVVLQDEGAYATLRMDDRARAELVEKPSGRILCAFSNAPAFFSLTLTSGKTLQPTRLNHVTQNVWAVTFPDVSQPLVFSVKSFWGGWTFSCATQTWPGVKSVNAACLRAVCTRYCGTMANMLSDDASGVCVRDYGPYALHCPGASTLCLTYSTDKFSGARFGLVAGARANLTHGLRALTLAAGLARSDCGGAWSLGASRNRHSYLMADGLSVSSIDEWISLAQRAGIGILHFGYGIWKQTGGWYEPREDRFPRGLDDLRDCSQKAHAAGLLTSFHTLSGCVHPTTPWVRSPLVTNLVVCHTYTLDSPIPSTGEVTEIRVREKPFPDHGFDFATWSRGNVLRIGTELFTYGDISFEPPYCFKKVKRAAYGTVRAAHCVGDETAYLWGYFAHFLAKPGTPLGAGVASRIQRIYDAGGFDMFYSDGADGYNPWPSDLAIFERTLFKALAQNGHPPLYEDSTWTSASWFFHSRIGANDYTRLATRLFTDRHTQKVMDMSRKANLLETNLGWWPVLTGSTDTYGYTLEEVAYFGAKCAGYDASFSMPLPSFSPTHVMSLAQLRQVTLLGWFERMRMARAFTDSARATMCLKGQDVRLFQDASGLWKLQTLAHASHRMLTPEDRSWRVRSPASEAVEPTKIRLRALDGMEPYDYARHAVLLSAQDAPQMNCTHAPGVTMALSTLTERGGALALTVSNVSARAAESWACAERVWPRPFRNLAAETGDGRQPFLALGLWVKGDGSGATLNVQLRTPKSINGSRNEHYVKLDFTTWRYIAFSIWHDHAAGTRPELRWPYEDPLGTNYLLYERIADVRHIEGASIWLTDVAPGKSAHVAVSPIHVVPRRHFDMGSVALTAENETCTLPFALKSEESAEWAAGYWTKYAFSGEPIQRVACKQVPRFKPGANACTLTLGNPLARVEASVFLPKAEQAALTSSPTLQTRQRLAYEAAWPESYAPSAGFDTLAPVRMRPNESARLSVEIAGKIVNPALRLGSQTRVFPVSLAANEKLVCSDGITWKVLDLKTHATRLQGALAKPWPTFTGSVSVALDTPDKANAHAQVRIVKHYGN